MSLNAKPAVFTLTLMLLGGCPPPMGSCVDERIEPKRRYVLTLLAQAAIPEPPPPGSFPPCPTDDLEVGAQHALTLDHMTDDATCRYLECPSSLPIPGEDAERRIVTGAIGSDPIICQNDSSLVSVANGCAMERVVTVFFSNDEVRLSRALSKGPECAALPADFPERCSDLWEASLRAAE